MSKITGVKDLSNLTTLDDLTKYAAIAISALMRAVNGGIDLQDNCATSLVSATFSAANSQVKVAHGLNRSPNGYLVAGLSANIVVFDGASGMNDKEIYVQASGAGTAKLLVF